MSGPAMELGKHVVDRGILDCDGRPAGKVDDLLLELPDDVGSPEVVALITGPTALAENLSSLGRRIVRLLYRLAGIADPTPAVIPWEHVEAIDVVVHLDLNREATGWPRVGHALRRRFLRWL